MGDGLGYTRSFFKGRWRYEPLPLVFCEREKLDSIRYKILSQLIHMIICVGFITDTHIPAHDPKALSAAMNCLADADLHALYLGGDIFDMYWANQHGPKDPRIYSTLESEMKEVNDFLDQIDKTFPNIQKRFIEGNHETRFERYVISNCPAMFGMTDLKLLIGMHNRPLWSYHPYGPNQLVGFGKTNLFAKHAPSGSSGPAIMNKAACNLIFGHIHRYISDRKTTVDGRRLSVTCPGWLGDGKQRNFDFVAGHQNWQQGFAKVYIDTDTWNFQIESVEIFNGQCMSGGKLYKG